MTQKVINFFAGPGAGKSTTATGVFSLLKMHDINCEYVSEVAKDLAWEGRLNDATFLDIMGKQCERMERLRDKVDFIITDSPLLMQAAYSDSSIHRELAFSEYSKWDNYNWFILRDKPFNPKGRNHSEQESIALDGKIEKLLEYWNQTSHIIHGNYHGVNHVVWKTLELKNKPTLITLDGRIN